MRTSRSQKASGVANVYSASATLLRSLQFADFVAVGAESRLPLRAAIDETGVGNEGLQRFDPLGFDGGGQRGNAGSLAGLNPCLTQRPCEALAADVRKLDCGVIVGLAEDHPSPAHCI